MPGKNDAYEHYCKSTVTTLYSSAEKKSISLQFDIFEGYKTTARNRKLSKAGHRLTEIEQLKVGKTLPGLLKR